VAVEGAATAGEASIWRVGVAAAALAGTAMLVP
jgi:hypothetical protein